MNYCCTNCFSDFFLKEHIEKTNNKKGTCFFCKSKVGILIKPSNLYDRFEPLLDLYEENTSGTFLSDILQSDWNIFSIDKKTKQRKLLQDITSNININKVKYAPIHSKDQTVIQRWQNFKSELKYKNRFFPNYGLTIQDIKVFNNYIGQSSKKGSQNFYRARVAPTDTPIELANMGKPPLKKASSGRANPIGIPYLYVASNIETAIAEVRCHKSESVTVAEYIINDHLDLADLRDPKNNISPFTLNEEDELELIYKNSDFLELLGEELSKPVLPKDANLEYLPSQYLCELLKHAGYHGIIYRSSIESGNNYVIFDDTRLSCIKSYQFKIINIKTTFEKLS